MVLRAKGRTASPPLYHYKTATYAMGSAARYRWGEWGYQETLLHARLGTDPQAQVWINHPGEVDPGRLRAARPTGAAAAIVPRVQQYRALAIVAFDGEPPQPDFTHAWFPRAAFDESRGRRRHRLRPRRRRPRRPPAPTARWRR